MAGGRDAGYAALLAVTFAFGGGLGAVVRAAAGGVGRSGAGACSNRPGGDTQRRWARANRPGGDVPGPAAVQERPHRRAFLCGLPRSSRWLDFSLPPASAKRRSAARSLPPSYARRSRRASDRPGLLVPIAAVLVGARLARPDTSARFAVIALSVAAALALLAAGSRFGASNSDQASAVFVPKTLFCNHLNIVLASDAARREIVSAAGDRADATMARLAADFAAEPGRWPVLGYFGDACLFDTALNRDAADDGNAVGAAAAYRRIFLAAVRDRPLAYAAKVFRQMAYGASVTWPPYRLDPAIPVSTDDVPLVSDIMTRHGRAAGPIDLQGGPVRIGILSDLPGISAYLFRALSTAFVIAIICRTVTAVRRRRPV